jgi:hypothetical protein
MKASAVETAPGEQMIERADAERQHGTARRGDARDRFAKRGKLVGTRPERRNGQHAHAGIDSNVLFMFHPHGTSVKAPATSGCGSFSAASRSAL